MLMFQRRDDAWMISEFGARYDGDQTLLYQFMNMHEGVTA